MPWTPYKFPTAALGIERNGDLQLLFLEELPNRVRLFPLIDRAEVNAFLRKLLGHFGQQRQLLDAGAAPSGPEIEHHNFLAGMVRQIEFALVEQFQLHVRRRFSQQR